MKKQLIGVLTLFLEGTAGQARSDGGFQHVIRISSDFMVVYFMAVLYQTAT